MSRARKRTARVVSAGVALAMSVGLASSVTPSAQADTVDDVLGVAGQLLPFFNYVKQGYDYYTKYVGGSVSAQQVSDVSVAQTKIVAEIDSVASSAATACAKTTVSDFLNINQFDQSTLQNRAHDADACVNTAAALIDAEGDAGKASIDAAGIAMNAAGPLALTFYKKAGFSTDALLQALIDGNRKLLTRLKPTCDVFSDNNGTWVDQQVEANGNPVIPGLFNPTPIPGHGACYSYAVTAPKPDSHGIATAPTGDGTGVMPNTITGDGEAVICGGVLHCGDTVRFPKLSDYSLAISQAMAATGYPVAEASLGLLASTLVTSETPVAVTVPASGSQIETPIPVFKVDADGSSSRGTLTPATNDGDVRFSGWTNIGGLSLKSVTSVANSDGRYQVFGLDRTGRLYTQWQKKTGDDSTWTAWAQQDGFFSSIAAARNANGTVQLIATDSDGKVMTSNQILNGDYDPKVAPTATGDARPAVDNWTPWKPMGVTVSQPTGVTMKQVSAVTHGTTIAAYGVNGAGEVWTSSQNTANASDPTVSGNWSDWTKTPNPPGAVRSLAVSNDLGGRLNVFGTLDNDTLVHLVNGTWQTVPGPVHNVATAMGGGGSGRIYALGRDTAGNTLLTNTDGIIGDSWTGWYCNLTTARTCSNNVHPYIAYQTTAHHLGIVTPDGLSHDGGVAMMPGTSPVSAKTNDGTETAYVGSDGFLYHFKTGQTPVKSGGGMSVASGTSPAITGDLGFWEIAITGQDGHIWTIDCTGRVVRTAGVPYPGTSPSITYINTTHELNPDSGPRIVYNGNDQHLQWINSAGTVSESGWAVQPGTSPAVASTGNDVWEILFSQAGTNHLRTFDHNGDGFDTGGAAASGTIPQLVAVAGSGYWGAVRGTDGFLYTMAPGPGTSWVYNGLGVAPGTSPSMSSDGFGGWEIAFHANGDSDHLWTFDSTGKATNTGIPLSPGTSPAIAIADH